MTDLRYPFDWETHAAQQLARQEEEALANSARIRREENPRHPLDKLLVKIEYSEARRNFRGDDNLGLYYDPSIPQAEMVLYLQQFWNVRSIIRENRVMTDLGIEYAPFDPGDWMVLSEGEDLGGYPLSNGEFLRRFVKKEE